MIVLGISAFYHDSAACLVQDGRIVAAAQEERFSRRKNDASFPTKAIEYCLTEGGITADDVDYIAFYEKPWLKLERVLACYLHHAPWGTGTFAKVLPTWLQTKLWVGPLLKSKLDTRAEVLFVKHHEAHAAAAFYPSPYSNAAVLTVDGVGEWATSSIAHGQGSRITPLSEIRFPHSLGLLYSAFTYFTGFRVNSGEYKMMGLAPYGDPTYVDLIRDRLIDIKDDGSFHLNMKYFDFVVGERLVGRPFEKLFGAKVRAPDTDIRQLDMDVARSVQLVIEEVLLKMARHAHGETGANALCLAGGVALNCVSNGRVLREGPFDDLWVQPAAGDAGSALGAALSVHHDFLRMPRNPDGRRDEQQGSYLGPAYPEPEIREFLDSVGASYTRMDDQALVEDVSGRIARGEVIGWFQGRLEFGPRALGARSILGDPRSEAMQSTMNLKIKFRESFRPFAPAVLSEYVSDYFEVDKATAQHAPAAGPYMLLVGQVREAHRRKVDAQLTGLERRKVARSSIPAITHVDYSARVQAVHREHNPLFHSLIEAFRQKTGCPMVINTSFNIRGEPIVSSPAEAHACFMRTEMDTLVVGPFILEKHAQPRRATPAERPMENVLD